MRVMSLIDGMKKKSNQSSCVLGGGGVHRSGDDKKRGEIEKGLEFPCVSGGEGIDSNTKHKRTNQCITVVIFQVKHPKKIPI